MEKYSIQTHNLTKKFDVFTAVDNVSMQIEKGAIYALIGENGVGKTTLVKMLVGLLTPSGGEAYINGFNIKSDPEQAKLNFGYIPDDCEIYEYLSGEEFLMFTAKLRGMSRTFFDKRYRELVDLFPIQKILKQPIRSYSRGSKQKTAFLAALLSQPSVLIIDEPVVGLDPESINIFGETLKKYALNGNTVFFVTHILSFAEKYASRIGLMKDGKLIKEDSVSKLPSLEKFMK
jgi:ABC-2 type transport system ATP-binding protein